MTVLICPVPDWASLAHFKPFSQRLRRKIPERVNWTVETTEVVRLRERELRENSNGLDRDVQPQSHRILRMLGELGRAFLDRETAYRFGWFRHVDSFVGV